MVSIYNFAFASYTRTACLLSTISNISTFSLKHLWLSGRRGAPCSAVHPLLVQRKHALALALASHNHRLAFALAHAALSSICHFKPSRAHGLALALDKVMPTFSPPSHHLALALTLATIQWAWRQTRRGRAWRWARTRTRTPRHLNCKWDLWNLRSGD